MKINKIIFNFLVILTLSFHAQALEIRLDESLEQSKKEVLLKFIAETAKESDNENPGSLNIFRKNINSKFIYYKAGDKITTANGQMSVIVPNGYFFITKGQADVFDKLISNENYNEELNKLSLVGIISQNNNIVDGKSHTLAYVYYDNSVGYVSDKDSKEINNEKFATELYDSFIANEKEKTIEQNKFENLQWLLKPNFDDQNKSYSYSWKFDQKSEDKIYTTVNTNLIKLNKQGYNLNIVAADIKDKDEIPTFLLSLNQSIVFTDGNKYSDFVSGVDKKSSMTIAGLAAGAIGLKLAAKLGFLAIFLKFSKILIIPIVLFFGKIKSFFINLFKRKVN